MKAFVSINKGWGGAEKQFDQMFQDLHQYGTLEKEWVYQRYDLSLMPYTQMLLALLKLRDGSIVYNMSVLGIGVFPLFVLKLLGNKILLYPHVVEPPSKFKPKLWPVRAMLQRLCVRIADYVVAISDGNFSTLKSFVPHAKLLTIYNYVNCENNSPFELNALNLEIAIIGRLQDRHKQQLTFLRKHGDFLRERGIIVHLFGSGPDEIAIRELVISQNLHENVKMHGWCDEDEIFKNNFSFVLNLSKWEGLPLSILEAIYQNRIVLLSNINGNRELAYNDFLFETDAQLRELIVRVVIEKNFDIALLRAQKHRVFIRCGRMRSISRLVAALNKISDTDG